ncbi:MAG: MarR family winged helix-turn-helix transcriptional regulator [Thermoplasmata archaeon]
MSGAVRSYADALDSLLLGLTHGLRGVLRQNNLTAVQFLVLQWASTEAPASMTALALYLGVRPQSVTPVVNSRVARGWIARRRSESDRRQNLLDLAPEARRLMTVFREARRRRIRSALALVPSEKLNHATEVVRITAGALVGFLEVPRPRAHAPRDGPRASPRLRTRTSRR